MRNTVKLKKGKNKLIIIGKPNGAYNATFSMKIHNEKGQLTVNIKDKKWKKVILQIQYYTMIILEDLKILVLEQN